MKCDCHFQDTSYLTYSCGPSPNLTLFMSLVDIMLRTSCRVADPCRRPSIKVHTSYPEEYDFIVVGGGVAGSVVAARLSETPKWNVLLLEAGPEEPTISGVPAFATEAIGTELDWGFKTVPQKKACLNTGGVCYWPRGKMLGGTGSMTGMMYMRGNRNIYNDWARKGNVGWSYHECLPFFKKSENNKNPEHIEKFFHGTAGPLVVQRFSNQPNFAYDLLRAGDELGYRTGDLNGINQTGFTIAQVMVDGGIRASTPRMYLRPAHRRDNLFVLTNNRVTRVLINKISKRAEGVEFIDKHGHKREVRANKEIILSAGAVGSPHLLLLSGVGPKDDLKNHGITVIQDLKVGHNLHNHVSVNVKFLVTDRSKNNMTMNAVQQYLEKGTGPLSSNGLTQTTAFLKSKYASLVPDLQVFFDGFSSSCPSENEELCQHTPSDPKCSIREINARPTNVMTLSSGTLSLKSNDPMDPPLINPNYLENHQDAGVLVEGIKLMINITKTDALKHWNIRISTEPKEKCKHLKFASDEYWQCVVRVYTGPENHPAGSCKMGPSKDNTAVVDPELRVHGIPNLRVIDASIFPYVPNSNPIAAIVMAAEKGSYMIKSAWQFC